ncbi:MAG: AraC-like DNA-binding protein [Lentimonas sp.]|jgi:AraC-like DNA-binding protein
MPTISKLPWVSLRDYRANCQLHLALSLMRNAQLSLSDVAELSGFNSHPSFTRFIKRMTGRAPSEVRMSQTSEVEK